MSKGHYQQNRKAIHEIKEKKFAKMYQVRN